VKGKGIGGRTPSSESERKMRKKREDRNGHKHPSLPIFSLPISRREGGGGVGGGGGGGGGGGVLSCCWGGGGERGGICRGE